MRKRTPPANIDISQLLDKVKTKAQHNSQTIFSQAKNSTLQLGSFLASLPNTDTANYAVSGTASAFFALQFMLASLEGGYSRYLALAAAVACGYTAISQYGTENVYQAATKNVNRFFKPSPQANTTTEEKQPSFKHSP